jgi:hypothetical protein
VEFPNEEIGSLKNMEAASAIKSQVNLSLPKNENEN